MMKLTYKEIIAIALLLAVIGGVSFISQQPRQAYGNVSPEDTLTSTTVPQVANRTNLCPAGFAASSTTGTLGSVHILSGGTGRITFYDATTTDVTLRSGAMATSTIYLADYPIGVGTTSNALNISFKRGLLVEYTTGIASTTVTYRCGS